MRRLTVPANTPWQDTFCYSRAVRVGNFIAVSQTSSVDADGNIAGVDPYTQAILALRNVEAALHAAGATLHDVVRSRIYLARFSDLQLVSKAHAEVFRDFRPAISIVTCKMVSPDILVEFEVDAIVGAPNDGVPNPANSTIREPL
jgi:enamine deaminase RidA (YjgF/YER057c/UK114 family)